MKKIIFDEKQQIEDIIAKKTLEKISIKRFLTLMVKYYFEEYKDLSAKAYKKIIQDKVLEFDMPLSYEEHLYDSYIDKLCRNIKNGKLNSKLKIIDKINITPNELNLVRCCDTDREKKLLFTLYVLAKTVLQPTGWVNYTDRQILDYANLKGVTYLQMHKIIHKIYLLGWMEFNHKIGVSGYKVDLDDESEKGLVITEFENFGNQYIIYERPEIMMCNKCKRLVKRNSNSQKYCKKCANLIEKEQWSIRQQKHRIIKTQSRIR